MRRMAERGLRPLAAGSNTKLNIQILWRGNSPAVYHLYAANKSNYFRISP